MSKNPQLDASENSLAASEDYLAHTVNAFHQVLADLQVNKDVKTNLDDLVKQIQHYTYRIALSNASVQLAESLQSVYLGCSDPTNSSPFWRYKPANSLLANL